MEAGRRAAALGAAGARMGEALVLSMACPNLVSAQPHTQIQRESG